MTLLFVKLLLLVLAGLAFIRLAWLWWRDGRLRQSRRASLFDGGEELFSNGRKRITETGFPRISGTYEGRGFDLQATPDTLNFRKLPALWALFTLTERQPVSATVDIVVRPRGVEPFSHFSTLPVQIEVPHGLPQDCAIRTDNAGALPDLGLLKPAIEQIFRNPRVKELVISPKGLRLVTLAGEADRSRYLLFRDSELGTEPLARDSIKEALDVLLDLSTLIKQDAGKSP